MTSYIFNKKQEHAIEKINEFVSITNSYKEFYLLGYAGTGKTFLICNIIKNLLKEKKIDHVYICTPTHQALNVIESYFRSEMISLNFDQLLLIDFMTIHKLLEFKPVISNNDGEKIFKSTKESAILKKINHKLVIIDECSMISSNMVTSINKCIELYPIKIIYLGDRAQLPPVNESESKIFTKIPKNYPYFIELDDIMRTKSIDIKKVSTLMRNWDEYKTLCDQLLQLYNTQKSNKTFRLFHKKKQSQTNHTEKTWFRKIIREINTGDCPIILTWRNETNDMYNNIIRCHIHKTNNIDNYQIGDHLIFNDYYSSLDKSSFYTSDIIKIIKITTHSTKLCDWDQIIIGKSTSLVDKSFNILITKLSKINNTFKIDRVEVERIYNDNLFLLNNSGHTILTINRDDLNNYLEYLKIIKDHFKFFSEKFKSDDHSSKLWNVYYKQIKEPYAHLSFGYSITTHKAQGSTFKKVYVDIDDITCNPNISEMKKMLYTASTRPNIELNFLLD